MNFFILYFSNLCNENVMFFYPEERKYTLKNHLKLFDLLYIVNEINQYLFLSCLIYNFEKYIATFPLFINIIMIVPSLE